MRLALLSDVHGNLPALESALAALRARRVDGWVCAGDLVGYGPWPNECVDALLALDGTVVAGNHELAVLGRLADDRSSERARASHAWTRERLRADVVARLEALPLRAQVGPVVVAHGSLDDAQEYVRTPERARRQVDQLRAEHPDARVLVLGNTHRQLLWPGAPVSPPTGRPLPLPRDGACVVNPGSVGQSRQWEWPPRARAAVLDLDAWTVELVRVPYDVRTARRGLRATAQPYRAVHSPPPLRRALARRGRRATAAVRRARR
ncbi:MAG: metallophosphoesterase family protein [Actinomycetes bacterium]